ATEYEHGPFSISRIYPNSYKNLTYDQLSNEFSKIANDSYFESLTSEMESEIKVLLREIAPANNFFKLELEIRGNLLPKPDRSHYHHDYSPIYWEFVEFIAIDRPSNLLYMMVFLYE
ncbi:MAG TPA: hypothetical protein PK078_12820, partial [Anaerolineales bacterium]|nr:hypothetical protein [Anaerolineales bacterium]